MRPSTTSSSCAGLSSATIDVHQHLVFFEPVRAKSVSSNRQRRRARCGRVLDQRGAVGTDGVHDGVPIAAELNSDVGDGAAITTDPGSHVSTRTIGHLRPRRRDPSIDLGERWSHNRHPDNTSGALCHTSTARRPNAGRSTNATWRRSFTRALVLHDRHATVVAVVSTWTRNGPAGSSPSTARTFTAGKPTNSAHTRVASVSTRARRFVGVRTPILRALEPSTADPRYPPTPPQLRSAPLRDAEMVPNLTSPSSDLRRRHASILSAATIESAADL